MPHSDKTLSIDTFIACRDIDDVYFDKPYYLAPVDRHAEDTFALIRDGMRAQKVAALAHTVLFRRVRTLLIRAYGNGLIATTLNFDYEVRSARDAFEGVPDIKIKGEMLDLAEHIIKTKRGKLIRQHSTIATRPRWRSSSRRRRKAGRSRRQSSRSVTR